jgi:hypothetical protein
MGITVTDLFAAAGLMPCGPVPWGTVVPERQPGVYVVAAVAGRNDDCDGIDVPYLKAEVAARWNPSQPVIYIGRTRRSLLRRIREFNKHVHGEQRPHRGGQDAKLLTCPLWVFWSPTDEAAAAEDKMIERFKKEVGRLPFANRVRSARSKELG